MKIIGFTGSMGVGKSTAISLLTANRSVKLVKFAGPLYEIQEFVYKTISPVYQRPANFTKDRKLLQWIGTDFGRSLSSTIWVDLFKNNVEAAKAEGYDIVVCDDVRFDNEAEAIHALGGRVIRIVSEKSSLRIDTTSGIANHKSEAGIGNALVDAQVPNNGTLAEFEGSLGVTYRILGIF